MSLPPCRVTLALPFACAVIAGAVAMPAAAAPLERQPYLQIVGEDEVTVVWTTTVDSSGSVEYGPAPDDLSDSVDSTMVDTQHEVRITGLEPATRYYYRVVSDGNAEAGGDEDHFFVTSPPVGTEAKMRAWVVGDSGTGGAQQAAVRDAMRGYAFTSQPDIFLHVGDMAYSDGTEPEFTERFFAMYEDILRNTVVWPAMGNHEGSSSDSGSESGPYYEAYVLPTGAEAGGLASGTEAYYSFDRGNVHFIVLDSHDSPREPDGPMLTWMDNDLASTQQDWVVAYWHHPPYTKGSHDSDVEGALIDMRENALPILEAGGVDLVLGGHSHIYERSFLLDGAYQTPSVGGKGVMDAGDGIVLGDGPYVKQPGLVAHDGAVYVVAGHGGTGVSQKGVHPLMYFHEVANGSCLLDVQGNRMTVTNIRWDGQVTDRVDMVKGDAIVVATPNGGESYAAGSNEEIRWATVGDVDTVQLEYSSTDGDEWTLIEDDVPNTGSYDWAVPGIDTTRALVRVSASDGSLADESNGLFEVSATADIEVIPFGDDWAYHDQGEDQGEAWRELDYDDSGWQVGPAQLGYGDDDEATMLVDAEPNYPSAYFRQQFSIEGDPLEAELSVLFDDGAAVWINGELAWSQNVDDTSYGAFASDSSDDNEMQTTALPAGLLVEGDNVVAVIVKQSSEGSSDLSFDLRLEATVMFDPPPPPPGDTGDSGGDDVGDDDDDDDDDDADGDDDDDDAADGATSQGGGSTSGGAGQNDGDGGGCGCRSSRHPPLFAWGLILMGIPVLRRRR